MSTIAIARPVPHQLTFDGTDWTLVTSVFEAIDRDVFAPVLSSLQGTETILESLSDLKLDQASNELRALVLSAPHAPLSYRYRDGRFVTDPSYKGPQRPRTLPPEPRRSSSRPPESMQTSLLDLRRELDSLRTRVRELEQILATTEPNKPPPSNENGHPHDESSLDAI